MKIHEFQGKQILARYGVRVPRGEVAQTKEEARAIAERLGVELTRYEGPTGIVGALTEGFTRAGIETLSFWAAVPHYVSLTPSPKAALALCERLAELIEADIDTTELAEAAENYSEQVSEAVASDPDTAAYIEELEQRADTLAEEADLPSGDALAAELTQFLRERERENGDDDVARGQ